MRSFYRINRIVLVSLCLFILFAGCSQTPKEAYVIKLSKNWEIDGDLPVHSLLITLQGIVNQESPSLYFIYPPNWTFTFSESLMDYYKNTRGIRFTELKTAEEVLEKYQGKVKNYIIWDKSVRTSLIVAFTAAGLKKAVVVTEDMIPLVEKYGMTLVEDFRGKFTGKSDTEIYSWAYDQYWDQCSKDYLVYMGGVHGKQMEPAIADFGLYKQAFFTDASADPADGEEYELAKKILGGMNVNGVVLGWHSYAKDTEAQHTTLCSHFGLRIEGLNSLPNMSFNTQIPLSKGYKFKNKHNIEAGKEYIPEDKVYISCIQTDCLGIGAWLKPGRGEIPYCWEVTMNWSWLAPAMMQYFYDMATPNDYFIGSLSGAGYVYPKAVPDELLPKMIEEARKLMEHLDLNAFEIMDHSEKYSTVNSNNNITKEVADKYYLGMPEAIGFANGYRTAATFDSRNGKPFISYDYYIDPGRSENEALLDLKELITMNQKRPYFLLLHVRQWKDIQAVARILKQLGEGVEVIPMDIFFKMAGKNPTFKTRYLPESKLVIK